MLMLFFFLILISLLSWLGLPILLATFSQNFHLQCLIHLPQNSSRDWIAALVCGERLPNPLLYKLLIDTSLVHLLVISVGHLQMLSWVFEQTQSFKKWPAWLRTSLALLRWLVLIFFSLMSGFYPPVVRALIAEILRSFSQNFRWHWSLFTLTTASGMLALAFKPTWIFSLSLYLPWICCLGFCLVSLQRGSKKHGEKSQKNLRSLFQEHLLAAIVIQVLMIIPLGEFRWEGVLANAFLMPLFGLFLFPISALTYLFHFLSPVADFFFALFAKVLRLILFLCGSPSAPPIPVFYPLAAWGLIIALSVMIQILSRQRWQKEFDESI